MRPTIRRRVTWRRRRTIHTTAKSRSADAQVGAGAGVAGGRRARCHDGRGVAGDHGEGLGDHGETDARDARGRFDAARAARPDGALLDLRLHGRRERLSHRPRGHAGPARGPRRAVDDEPDVVARGRSRRTATIRGDGVSSNRGLASARGARTSIGSSSPRRKTSCTTWPADSLRTAELARQSRPVQGMRRKLQAVTASPRASAARSVPCRRGRSAAHVGLRLARRGPARGGHRAESRPTDPGVELVRA